MDSIDQVFQEKMHALYQLEETNLGHATLLAMAETYLGAGLDKTTAGKMMALQDELDQAQRLLYRRLQTRQLDDQDYLVANNRLIGDFATSAERILGKQRFRMLFKASAMELSDFLKIAMVRQELT